MLLRNSFGSGLVIWGEETSRKMKHICIYFARDCKVSSCNMCLYPALAKNHFQLRLEALETPFFIRLSICPFVRSQFGQSFHQQSLTLLVFQLSLRCLSFSSLLVLFQLYFFLISSSLIHLIILKAYFVKLSESKILCLVFLIQRLSRNLTMTQTDTMSRKLCHLPCTLASEKLINKLDNRFCRKI